MHKLNLYRINHRRYKKHIGHNMHLISKFLFKLSFFTLMAFRMPDTLASPIGHANSFPAAVMNTKGDFIAAGNWRIMLQWNGVITRAPKDLLSNHTAHCERANRAARSCGRVRCCMRGWHVDLHAFFSPTACICATDYRLKRKVCRTQGKQNTPSTGNTFCPALGASRTALPCPAGRAAVHARPTADRGAPAAGSHRRPPAGRCDRASLDRGPRAADPRPSASGAQALQTLSSQRRNGQGRTSSVTLVAVLHWKLPGHGQGRRAAAEPRRP
jgi:hypothetical protein